MDKKDYERAFDEFLENKLYDETEETLFRLVREAFKAGFIAAGGKYPEDDGIVDIFGKR